MHCDAASDSDTDWAQILALYDMLVEMVPTWAVRTARIVALSHVEGPVTALAELDAPGTSDTSTDADRYALAVRADLLERAGEAEAAREVFLQAAELAGNEAERAHLRRRAEGTGGESGRQGA